MKLLIRSLLVFSTILLLVLNNSSAAGEDSLKTWRENIAQSIRSNKARKVQMGLCAYDLSRGKMVAVYEAEELFVPASVVKILTSAAALEHLGGYYRFQTEILSDTPLKDGKINHLYYRGDGNPKQVTEQIWLLCRQLRFEGLREITGDIIIDDGFFADEPNGRHNRNPDNHRPYNAPVSAASLNFNTITIHIKPAGKIGEPVWINPDPDSDYIKITNKLKTVSKGRRAQITLIKQIGETSETIVVTGVIPLGYSTQTKYLSISHPPYYLGYTLKKILQDQGISVKGKVRTGTIPEDICSIFLFSGEPLWKSIGDMNKYSNNFMAEQLLRVLGADDYGPPATLQKGLRFLRNYLEKKGLNPENYSIKDASGLSRENRFAPAQITDFLVKIYNEKLITPEFMTSFAISASDGTMNNRFHGSGAEKMVRAKSGSLNKISTLAGYMRTREGNLLAFTVMIEGPLSYYQLLGIRDELTLKIYAYPGTGTHN